MPVERFSSLSYSEFEEMCCGICIESIDYDEINFFPCQCGYQICKFCWDRIRHSDQPNCPNCRKKYDEEPYIADVISDALREKLENAKNESKNKGSSRSAANNTSENVLDPYTVSNRNATLGFRNQSVSENRKHLANVRVLQKNLVFVIGLSSNLAKEEVLRKYDYFGRYGTIKKVAISNNSQNYAGSSATLSASAYLTYTNMDDALRAIKGGNGQYCSGRTLKCSLGTTKYCSRYLRNQECTLNECMYLHDVADREASFTKSDMNQGKHTEYEQSLMDDFVKRELNKISTASKVKSSSKTNNNTVNIKRQGSLVTEKNDKNNSSINDENNNKMTSPVNQWTARQIAQSEHNKSDANPTIEPITSQNSIKDDTIKVPDFSIAQSNEITNGTGIFTNEAINQNNIANESNVQAPSNPSIGNAPNTNNNSQIIANLNQNHQSRSSYPKLSVNKGKENNESTKKNTSSENISGGTNTSQNTSEQVTTNNYNQAISNIIRTSENPPTNDSRSNSFTNKTRLTTAAMSSISDSAVLGAIPQNPQSDKNNNNNLNFNAQPSNQVNLENFQTLNTQNLNRNNIQSGQNIQNVQNDRSSQNDQITRQSQENSQLQHQVNPNYQPNNHLTHQTQNFQNPLKPSNLSNCSAYPSLQTVNPQHTLYQIKGQTLNLKYHQHINRENEDQLTDSWEKIVKFLSTSGEPQSFPSKYEHLPMTTRLIHLGSELQPVECCKPLEEPVRLTDIIREQNLRDSNYQNQNFDGNNDFSQNDPNGRDRYQNNNNSNNMLYNNSTGSSNNRINMQNSQAVEFSLHANRYNFPAPSRFNEHGNKNNASTRLSNSESNNNNQNPSGSSSNRNRTTNLNLQAQPFHKANKQNSTNQSTNMQNLGPSSYTNSQNQNFQNSQNLQSSQKISNSSQFNAVNSIYAELNFNANSLDFQSRNNNNNIKNELKSNPIKRLSQIEKRGQNEKNILEMNSNYANMSSNVASTNEYSSLNNINQNWDCQWPQINNYWPSMSKNNNFVQNGNSQ